MAKKKKNKDFPLDELPEGTVFMTEDELADIHEMGVFLTNLLYAVNPSIDRGHTFEYVVEMLNQGTAPEVAEFYGGMIRMTGFEKPGTDSGMH